MKQLLNIRRWVVVLTFALCSVATFAEQPTLSASFSRDSVEVGDQFDYTIEVVKDRATEIGIPDFDGNPTAEDIRKRNEALAHISTFKEYNESKLELIEEFAIDTLKVEGRTLHLRKRYRLAAMETGDLRLRPAILYFEKNREQPDTIYAKDTLVLSVARYEELDTLSFMMLDPSGQGTKINTQLAQQHLGTEGITTQKDLPFRFLEVRDYVIYGLIALVLLSLTVWFVASQLYKYMRKREATERVLPKIAPHIVANKALVELNHRKLWQNGKYKLYYTELTAILRVYISERWGISAMEYTTPEIIEALSDIDMPRDSRFALVALLRTADMVKFAKAEPDADENEENYTRAYYFVENTKLIDEAENEGKEDITIETKIGE